MRNYLMVATRAYWLAAIAILGVGGPARAQSVDEVQRGLHVYMDFCVSCHSLKYVKYRHLSQIGLSTEEIDVLRGKRRVDEPVLGALPNDIAQQYLGMIPPDLSLIAQTRRDGESHISALLTGYFLKQDGVYENRATPGTRMPDVLDSAILTDAADQQRIRERASAVATFLAWAADPHAQERYTLGYYVVAYFVLLSLLLWLVKRKIWARLK